MRGVVLRGAGFGGLAAWGAAHWAGIVAPPAATAMALSLAVALVCGVALRGCRARRAPVLGVVAAGVAGALVVAGVPATLLWPGSWGELAAGLGQGIGALPEVALPYAGADPWARTVIVAGGCLLMTVAAALAFYAAPLTGPRRTAATIALVALYAVPAAELTASHQYLRGSAFAVFLAGWLWLERARGSQARLAVGLLSTAVVLAALLAPRVDAASPWIDYESLAESLAPSAAVSFDFDHRYGRLDWPRDGRELLRIKAPRRAYWKSVDLDVFDGTRWVHDARRFGATLSDELPAGYRERRDWNATLRVTVRGLRSTQLVGAGTSLVVQRPPSAAVSATAPGTFTLESPLRSGDSYRVSTYAPDPSESQLASAGTRYPQLASRYLELAIPAAQSGTGGRSVRVAFAAWGSPAHARGPGPTSRAVLSSSTYAGAWALSRRLASGVRSPYEYVRRVLARLARGYAYSEAPPRRAVPLEAFLLRDRTGYCQQFSGAMALLLRMGGVPARVVGGFAPGSYDVRRGEWVVRDLDAHSWVEAYFPGYGWVTFDPTPAAAPARSQVTFSPAGAPRGDDPEGAARPGDRPQRGGTAGSDRSGSSWVWPAAAALAALVALAALAGSLRGGSTPGPGPPALDELERALRRARQPLAASTTLYALERRFAARPEAVAYMRTLRAARFGHGEGSPTTRQRRGVRRALGEGRGLRGRLRALWALPPRWRPRVRF